jgi:hypothetical protein
MISALSLRQIYFYLLANNDELGSVLAPTNELNLLPVSRGRHQRILWLTPS